MTEKQNAASLSLNVFDLIENVCDDFRKAWKHGARPRIEEFLGKAPEQASKSLFRNLLYVEIRVRRNNGESLSSREYAKRFPQYQQIIRRAFDEPSIVSNERLQALDTPDNQAYTVTQDLPAANRLGSFELIRELGRGGFGVVYEARHAETGNVVALKTLLTGLAGQNPNADRLYRFRHEFRRLCEINHPNLVGMQTLEVDDSQWFFTMDLVDGEDFLSFVRPHDELHEDRLRACLKQLAKGILELHQRGIIHRDLKPGNLLVSSTGHLTVLDFGLAAQLPTASELTQTKSGMFAGTPTYAAPEQLFGQRTEASDWYALGTMLYEALVGERPFRHSDPMTLLRMKQEQEAPQLAGQEGLPADLSSLVDGLLRREPGSRLTGATVGQLLGIDDTTDSHLSTADCESTENSLSVVGQQSEFLLVGRQPHLTKLNRAIRRFVNETQTEVIWVCGRSGAGKSVLVEASIKFLREEDDCLILSGRCYDREILPFKAIDCWLDSLIRFLSAQPKHYLREIISAELFWLTQVFPVFNRAPLINSLPFQSQRGVTPENLRQLAFMALRNLLLKIAQTHSLVLVVDDLHWADEDSAEAFHTLLSGSGAPPILFLGCYRSDEMSNSGFLNRWQKIWRGAPPSEQIVEVGPLTLDDTVDLIKRMRADVNGNVREVAARIYEAANGNAFLLSQLVDLYDPSDLSARPASLKQVVENRLSQLPEEARDILEMVSVFGKALPADEVVAFADQNEQQFGTLTKMGNEKLLRSVGSGKVREVDTFHDQIREATIAQLSREKLLYWHRRICGCLERIANSSNISCLQYPLYDLNGRQTPTPDVQRLFDLAIHAHKSKSPRGLDYLVLAGEASLRAYSNLQSVALLQKAVSLLNENTPNAVSFRIYMGLAIASKQVGHTESAIAYANDANGYTSNRTERFLVHTTEAAAHCDLGHIKQSMRLYDSALVLAGKPRPQTSAGQLVRIFKNLLLLTTVRTYFVSPRVDSKNEMTQQAVSETTDYLFLVLCSGSSLLASLDIMAYGCIECFRSDDEEVVSSGYSMLFVVLVLLGAHRKAASIQKLHESRAPIQNPKLKIRSEYHYAFANYVRGDMVIAIETLRQLAENCKKTGDWFVGILAHHFLRHAYGWCAPSVVEHGAGEDEVNFARNCQNRLGTFWGLYACADALARRGHLENATKKIQEAWHCGNQEAGSGTAVCLLTEGFLFVQASTPKRAAISLAKSWSWIKANYFFVDYMCRCLPVWVDALLGPNWNQEQDGANPKLRALSRWMSLYCTRLIVLRPLCERARGRLAASKGQSGRAIRHFEKSAQLALKSEMPFYRAKALLDLSVIKEAERAENRAEAIRLLKEMKSVIPRAESWQLGDQYDESVVAPQFDIDAWEQEHGCISTIRESD